MKHVAFSLIFALIIQVLSAQSTAYVKVTWHGAMDKIEKVSTGGYITTGQDSNYKVQLIRWDEQFNPVWKYKFTDANLIGYPQSIVEANDGNFFYMSTSGENSGCTFVAKFSSSGSILWQKKYYVVSGNMNSVAFSKGAGTDNGFLFGGGQCTLSNYIIKCNSNGDIEWQKQYIYPLSTGVITCWSIIPDGNNYVVSSGYNINSLLTMKIDASGTVLSHSAYTYSGMQILPTRIVKLNSTGGYAILGNYNSSNNNKTEFTAIYDSGLNLLTFNELTVTYTQFILWDMASVNNGDNVVLNGSIIDNTGFKAAIIKLSGTGNVVWKKMASGNSPLSNKNVEFRGIALKGNASVNAGFGYNEGCVMSVIDDNGNGLCNDVPFDLVNVQRTLTQQSQTITAAPSTAVSATVNYSGTTAVSTTKEIICGNLGMDDNVILHENISMYPNPAGNTLYLSNKENGPLKVLFFDTAGRLIKILLIGSGENEIQTGFLSPGSYILQIIDLTKNHNSAYLKLIKL